MFTLTIQNQNGQTVHQDTFDPGQYVIGRLDTCDIVLDSSSVSRQHARISTQQGRCVIEDLGSSNGVLVDGQRVVGQRDLGTASQIRVGDFYVFFELQQQAGLSGQQRSMETMFIPQDSDHFKIVRINDSFAGEEFILSETQNTIGRTDDNFILLSDHSISRYHARIIRHGGEYAVEDLDSSNGTTINGKTLSGAKTLSSGDRVKFGNVEFVFIESDAAVDPRMQPLEKEGSSFVRIAGSAILLLSGVALGGALLFSLMQFKGDNDGASADADAQEAVTQETVDPVAQKLTETLKRGERALERQEWDVAFAAYSEAVDLAPDNEQAQSGRERARREREAAKQLDAAGMRLEEGRHREALDLLEEIPERTKAYERSRTARDHTRRTLAHNLRTEAMQLAKKGRRAYDDAHDKYVASLRFDPEDAETLERVKKLEKKMRRAGIDFEPYSP